MVTTLWTVIKLQHRVRDGEGKVNQKMSWHVVGLLDSEMSLPLRSLNRVETAHWSAVSLCVLTSYVPLCKLLRPLKLHFFLIYKMELITLLLCVHNS